jgi:hypothetical protein
METNPDLISSHYERLSVSGARRLTNACFCSGGKFAMATRIDAKSLGLLSIAPYFAPPRSKSPLLFELCAFVRLLPQHRVSCAVVHTIPYVIQLRFRAVSMDRGGGAAA